MAKIDWDKIKLEVLRRIDIRAEAEALGVRFAGGNASSNGWAPCHAIDREDRNPSAAICVAGENGALGRYVDKGGDGRKLSFFDLAAALGPFSDWKEALKHFAKKSGFKLPSKPAASNTFTDQIGFLSPIERRPLLDRSFRRFLESKPPITLDSLIAAGGKTGIWPKRSSDPWFCIVFEAFREEGDEPCGMILYRADGLPFPEMPGIPIHKTHNLRGSKDGWVPISGWEAIKQTHSIWVAEGITDGLSLLPQLPDGHAVVSNIAGADGKHNLPLSIFKGKRVFVVGDADVPGQKGAENFAAIAAAKASEIRLVTLPYEIVDSHGKDLRDFLHEDGTFEDLLKLADEAEPVAAKPKANPKQNRRPPRETLGDDPIPAGSALYRNPTDPIPIDNPAVEEEDDDPHRLARLCRRKLGVIVSYRDEFHHWKDSAYRTIKDGDIRGIVTDCIKVEFDRLNKEAIDNWMPKNDDEKPPKAKKVTRSLVSDVLQALQGYCQVPADIKQPAWFESDELFPAGEVLATNNGLLHLPRFVANKEPYLILPTPSFFSANALDYEFDSNAQEPKIWLEFVGSLWQAFEDSIATLQEWFGYCLLPDTRRQKILLLVGPKRSGKGTIARILRRLIGVLNVAGPTLASLGTQFGLQPLLGKTLAIISDARLSGRSDTAVVIERLLSISGEDAQTVARKFLPAVTTTLPTRFMILTNELPRLGDASGALAGRMIVLQLRESFYGREDHHLTDRLLTELPGILLWAIEGWKRLRDRGHFLQPKSSAELVEEMEELTSPTGQFVRECCVLPHQLDDEVFGEPEIETDRLYEAYRKWCEKEGISHADTKSVFGRNLRAVVPSIKRSQPREDGERVNIYRGIGLRGDSGTG